MPDIPVLRFVYAALLFISFSAGAEEYVFTAPPREAGGAENDAFQPLVEYLSAKTGKTFVYRYSDNFLTYQSEMRAGKYDLVFDGPHFISWRMIKQDHEPLVRLPGKLGFVVIVKKDNDRVATVKDLAGRMVCGFAPPNLATLTLYNQFDNPARQPLIVEAKSFKQVYENVLKGRCMAGVMRDVAYAALDKDVAAAKVIFRSGGVSNQGFSAGPRLPPGDRQKITEALLAPEARAKLTVFFGRYNKDKDLVKAGREEFEGLAGLLKDVWGFSIDEDAAKPVAPNKGGR